MRHLPLALFAACAFSVPAVAQTNAPPSPAPSTVTDSATTTDDQKLICVDQDPNTASRLAPKRICHTKQEWSKLGGVPK